MSLRNIIVQYVGDTLYLPTLEREVKHITVRKPEVNGFEYFVPERTCYIVKEAHKIVLSDGMELFENGCSECNSYLDDDDNYCPNCGAKVVSE